MSALTLQSQASQDSQGAADRSRRRRAGRHASKLGGDDAGHWVRALSASLLYVGNVSGYDDVKVYLANGKDPTPMAVISDNLNTMTGDCIDGDGTLYVVNEPAGTGWVTEFTVGKTKSSKIIDKGINTPGILCAIDGKGNLWVTNIGGQNVTERWPRIIGQPSK